MQPIVTANTKYSAKVVELLRLEASAIELAAERLDLYSVERAVDLLACCGGKVIVTGVGKSGVIGQKIAQTLTSTGTVGIFVHPSDALHESLGVIQKGDGRRGRAEAGGLVAGARQGRAHHFARVRVIFHHKDRRH